MDCQYTLYIVRCSDNTYYTGMTSDLKKRIDRHNSIEHKDTWSKYTKSRHPVELVFSFKGIKTKRSAMKGEIYIKSLNRHRKELLINGDTGVLKKLEEITK